MQIPFNQFEQYIDEPILKRGLFYFKNGYVQEPVEISSNKYEAIVNGTEEYVVNLTIEKQLIHHYSCTCPYEGEICKHITAVIFYLQQDVLNITPKLQTNKTAKPKNTNKRNTIEGQVTEILQQISSDDLKKFVLEKCKNDKDFRNIFLSTFAFQGNNETKEFYAKQIKQILRSAGSSKGYIDYYKIRQIGKAVYDIVETVPKHIEKNNYQTAIFICLAVTEELTPALQYADDSNADISGNIDFAFSMLQEISQKDLPENDRQLLFDLSIKSVHTKVYDDWGWNIRLLELANHIAKTDAEIETLLNCIKINNWEEFEQQKIDLIRYNIINKTKGRLAATEFLNQNLSNEYFRKMAIENAIETYDYNKATDLAQKGYEQDKKNKPGLALTWYEYFLKIAQLQNDTKKIIEHTRFLYLQQNRNTQNYYQILNKTVAPENWYAFLEALINTIDKEKQWEAFHYKANIYITECWWDRLLELLKQNVNLNYIDTCEKFLKNEYPTELAALYENAIINYLKSASNRDHYKIACTYLKKVKKLGASEKVNQLVTVLKFEYPKRKALIEELNKV